MENLRIAKHRTKHPLFLAGLLGSPLKGAEIGVERGTTTQQLLTSFPDLHIIAVDPWLDGYEDWDLAECRREFDLRAKAFPRRITVFDTDSISASKMVADDSLDFVFIDAVHTYEAVIADIAAWSPKVKPGGFITGHDYGFKDTGVKRAVDEVYPNARIDTFSSVWWIRQIKTCMHIQV